MKSFNLTRLMDACCVDISKEYYDELFNYLMDIEVDLNTLNIDDIVVNGINFIDNDELAEIDEDDIYILSRTDDGAYTLN